jgi:hypothetical protein
LLDTFTAQQSWAARKAFGFISTILYLRGISMCIHSALVVLLLGRLWRLEHSGCGIPFVRDGLYLLYEHVYEEEPTRGDVVMVGVECVYCI